MEISWHKESRENQPLLKQRNEKQNPCRSRKLAEKTVSALRQGIFL